MKSRLLLLLLLFAVWARADDELVTIDAANNMITVQQRGALKTFRIKPFTDVIINGVKATVAQLKPGMQANIALADAQTASKITARGNLGLAPTAGTPTPKPMGGLSSTQTTRRIVFKAAVDAGDNLIIENGKLRIQHIDWSKPIDISINGIKWKPQWEGNNSDDFTGFTPPLASFAGATVTLKKLKGRGDATIVEPPTEANGQKLVVHLQDKGGGASEFEIHLTW